MRDEITIDRPIQPVSAEIFYEDGVPYIKYKGTTCLNNGIKVMVEIPKLSLVISGIESNTESEYDMRQHRMTSFKREFFATTNDVAFLVKTLSRTCSKADLEKELGYKLNLTE